MKGKDGGRGKREPVDISDLSWRQIMEMDACMRCGECTVYCPTYQHNPEPGKEYITPRGKILKFRKFLKGQHGLMARLFGPKKLDDAKVTEMSEEIYECTVCGQCHTVCPSRINTIDLWEDMRKVLVKAGYGPLKEHSPLITSIKSYDNPWQQPRSGRDRWTKSLRKEAPVKDMNKEKEKPPVLYYVGCTASYDPTISRKMGINTAMLLSAAGVDFGILGKNEKCCGSTPLRMGDIDVFSLVALDNIKMFNSLGIKEIVTSCSGCFKTIKQDYPKFGKSKYKVYHIVEYIEKLISEGRIQLKNGINIKITYHDPCHLGRHNGIYEAPRNILKAIPGVQLVEMERSREMSRCCGAGGGVKTAFPNTAQEITNTRAKDVVDLGVDAVVTACPFCYQSLELGLKAIGSKIPVYDVTEFVIRSMGIEVPMDEKEKRREEKAAKEGVPDHDPEKILEAGAC
jgi:heterodisulfide reductase subunit D